MCLQRIKTLEKYHDVMMFGLIRLNPGRSGRNFAGGSHDHLMSQVVVSSDEKAKPELLPM